MKNILLVDPNNFQLETSINPWMNVDVEVDPDKMKEQWINIKDELENLNCNVEVLPSQKNLPDMVFAANAGMVYKEVSVISSFRDKSRKGEEDHFYNWFKKTFPKVEKIKGSKNFWEGQACSVIWDTNAIFSISSRANEESAKQLIKIWSLEQYDYRLIELIDPFFYHLDVCFCLINDDTAMLCPMAFKQADYEWISSKFSNIINVTYDDALNFSCNACVIENNILLNDNISSDLENKLKQFELNLIKINVSEFIKSGGGVKCLIFQY
jgi:N-dimethylarginine dimethylaminohydrolase